MKKILLILYLLSLNVYATSIALPSAVMDDDFEVEEEIVKPTRGINDNILDLSTIDDLSKPLDWEDEIIFTEEEWVGTENQPLPPATLDVMTSIQSINRNFNDTVNVLTDFLSIGRFISVNVSSEIAEYEIVFKDRLECNQIENQIKNIENSEIFDINCSEDVLKLKIKKEIKNEL